MQVFVSRDVNVSTITIAANHPFAITIAANHPFAITIAANHPFAITIAANHPFDKLITLANRKLPTSLNIKANKSDST